jgi:hypothetical protein
VMQVVMSRSWVAIAGRRRLRLSNANDGAAACLRERLPMALRCVRVQKALGRIAIPWSGCGAAVSVFLDGLIP